MGNLDTLKTELSMLTVFRELLDDSVIVKLCNFLNDRTPSNYSEFVAELYNENGGNLSRYIKRISENSENAYVKAVGKHGEVNGVMANALENDLFILQKVSDLTSLELTESISGELSFPQFITEKIDIVANYKNRVANIGKYGYGIYAKNRMFYIDENNEIVAVNNPDNTQLSDLIDYERERKIIIDNTKALLEGKPAANMLLTGDAGTGKSSTVKAVVNALWEEGLRIIEVRKDQLHSIQKVLDDLSTNPLKFIIFIDDLSFLKDDDNFNSLKAVLEGSVTAKSENVVIYATSNRRHIIKEKFSDRDGDDIHRNDTMQELVSLSERFGIHITFSKPDKKTFLKIVHHLAEEKNITVDENELDLLAERFALERGSRSARLAKQFIDNLISKQ